MINNLKFDYKMAFFDFDDTLAITIHHKNNYLDEVEFSKKCLMGLQTYEERIPNYDLKWYIEKLKENNCKIYCITWGYNTLSYKAKLNYLNKHFENLFDDIFYSGIRDGKLKIIDLVKQTGFEKEGCYYTVKKDEVLFVDDHPETLDEISKSDYSVMSPLEITYLKRKIEN